MLYAQGPPRRLGLPEGASFAFAALLVSSGLGGIFPKGIPVARVVSATREDKHLFRTVKASPTVDFNKLEEVLIMFVRQKETPWK